MGDTCNAVRCGQVRFDTRLIECCQLASDAVDDQFLAVFVPHQQAEIGGFFVRVHQHWGVGVLGQIVQVDLARFHQAMHHRKDEQAVGARCDADPIVCHSVITSADRVHANDACAAGFDFADAHFDRVGIVVFSHTEQHEQFCVVPIGLTKFPERAAHRVDTSRCHVDRAEAAVGCVVWRAKVLRPERSEGLRLIAACKERQLFRGFFADRFQPVGGQLQGFFPADGFEFA